MIALLLTVLCLLPASAGAARISLPVSLETLDDEALLGTDIQGLVELPDTVSIVGDHVFDDTSVYALDFPASVTRVGAQSLSSAAAYAYLRGSASYAGLQGMRYVFVDEHFEGLFPGNVEWYVSDELVSDGLFYYGIVEQGSLGSYLKLLCAVDNLLIPGDVVIPGEVDGIQVGEVAYDAFIGCPQIRTISLSSDISVDENAFISCPNATINPIFNNQKQLVVWATEAAREVTLALIQRFQAQYPKYADWEIILQGFNEGNAAGMVLSGKPVDVYTFAQDQLGVLASQGALAAVPAAYTETIKSSNDTGAVAAASMNDTLFAYPITSDNGYFLFYDADIVTDPDSLETILYDCERAGTAFCMELSSGWYNVAFFFGAGCSIDYEYSNGQFTACDIDVANANGLKALKAMIQTAQSPIFEDSSEPNDHIGALVSGMWYAESFAEQASNPAAVKLPTVNGFQLGSFGGFKMIGVKDQGDPDRLNAAHALAAWLSSVDAQAQRQNALGWLGSSAAARAQADMPWAAQGLAAQSELATPQSILPGDYWTVSSNLGNSIVNGELNDLSDDALMAILQQYQSDLAALVQ
ncbi:MAG: extracellular solute-binding protein [Clostridia bacterium]|nr:extracellular solute-binding protein [Clostridia bacterium]